MCPYSALHSNWNLGLSFQDPLPPCCAPSPVDYSYCTKGFSKDERIPAVLYWESLIFFIFSLANSDQLHWGYTLHLNILTRWNLITWLALFILHCLKLSIEKDYYCLCSSLNNAPFSCSPHPCLPAKEVHFLNPASCEYATSHSKRDLADVVKWKIWRWGDDPESSGEPNVLITRVLIARKQTREDGSRGQKEGAVLLVWI